MRHTAKHELFAQFLADGMTQAEAYLKAGFACSPENAHASASHLLKRNTSIVKRRDEIIAERQRLKTQATVQADAKIIKEFQLDREEFLAKMYDIYEKGVAAQPVLDNKGVPIGEYRTNLQASIAALKALGSEMHGIFVDKKEVRTGTLEDLPKDELLQRAKEEAAKMGMTFPKTFGQDLH